MSHRITLKNILKRIWEKWKRIAHRIGVINTHILLFLFYFLIFGPFALAVQLFRRNILDNKLPRKPMSSYWKPQDFESTNLEQSKHQF